MQLPEIIAKLAGIQARLEASFPKRVRPFFEGLDVRSRAVLLMGARGTGKTTFLLHHIVQEKQKYLYVSVDNPMIANFSLWEIAQESFHQGYEGIVFDEIHFAKDWSKYLKAIYDAFPTKKILISDSSSIALYKSLGDLSRRFVRKYMPLLSFREYIFLQTGVLLPKSDPFVQAQSIKVIREYSGTINFLAHFKSYLNSGFRPIFEEGEYSERILSIMEKIIFSDIPFFIPSMQGNYLRVCKAVVSYLALSSIPTLNIEAMTRQWEIGKEKLYTLLSVMEQTHLIRIIHFCSDKKLQTKGAKIFLHDPSMYSIFGGDIGNVREAFVVSQFQEMGEKICVPKDTQICDFIVNGLKIEIGGKRKEIKRANFVVRDDIDFPVQNAIPLWVLGLMY